MRSRERDSQDHNDKALCLEPWRTSKLACIEVGEGPVQRPDCVSQAAPGLALLPNGSRMVAGMMPT